MSPLVDRFIAAADLAPAQSWSLAEWCREHGADEFTVAMLALENSPASFLDEAEALLKPFERPTSPRQAVTALRAELAVQPTKLWALTQSSLGVLRLLFRDGLFTYPTSEWDAGCLEDPTFYREGEIMLGVVSHEREGVLTLTELEQSQVAALGIPTRDRAEWI